MPPDFWDPDLYARFASKRSRPFYDLLELVTPIPGGWVVDLGCGTGELTAELHRRTRSSETLGIDSSEAMLAKAAAFAGGGLRFEQGDIGAFAPAEPYDLVFSNAALHWVPDHPALLARFDRRHIEDVEVPVASKETLIRTKATDRDGDRMDIGFLRDQIEAEKRARGR